MRDLSGAIDLIKEFEGCVLHAYKDPVGIWTIGYGTTEGVHAEMVITKEKATELLLDDCEKRAAHLLSKIHVSVTDNELGAMLSLSYNIGLGAFDHSTLLKKLNNGEPHLEVADEFLKWVRAGGRVLSGLVRRRKAERTLFMHSSHAVELLET